MKYRVSHACKRVYTRLTDTFFRYLFWSAGILTIFVNPLLYLLENLKVREILPHVITYESCNLALLGIIFALAMGIKDGAVAKVLQKKEKKIITSSYWRVFFACFSSVVTLLISIAILCLSSWSIQWIRMIVQFAGVFAFMYSVLSTVHLLYYFTYLMVEDVNMTKQSK